VAAEQPLSGLDTGKDGKSVSHVLFSSLLFTGVERVAGL
jgi:hypothetical protein